MPRQDNKTLLQPIDIIFRFLQGISFFKVAVHFMHFPQSFSLTDSQNRRSDLAVRSTACAYRGSDQRTQDIIFGDT